MNMDIEYWIIYIALFGMVIGIFAMLFRLGSMGGITYL